MPNRLTMSPLCTGGTTRALRDSLSARVSPEVIFLVLVISPEFTPVLHHYLQLYTKPNARFTVIVDTDTPYAAQPYASQESADSILIEL